MKSVAKIPFTDLPPKPTLKMSKRWTAMKSIIQSFTRQDDLFLTLIEEDGTITCANATMLKELELEDPRDAATNFFDLVHPAHLTAFKDLVRNVSRVKASQGIELYIRNGHYHPMKWHVNYLIEEASCSKKTYLCLGYNILDEERQQKFNSLAKQNYQLLVDTLSGIIFHDGNGDIVATNQKTAAIFKTSLEQLYQIRNTERLWNNKWNITDEDGNVLTFEQSPFIKALRTGKVQQETLRICLSDGEEKWILFNSQPLPETETGGDFAVVSSLIDVTNERKLSARLQEREALIDSFLQQTPHLSWVVDESANLLFASKAFYDHFGIDESQAANKKIVDIVPAKVLGAVYEQHLKVFQSGKPMEVTHRVQWADGSNFISHVNLFALGKIGGKNLVGGQAVYLPDKTEIEKELHHAHERLVNITNATSDAIWEWDMQTGHIVQNEKLLDMTGYHPSSRGFSWWLRHIHRDDRNRVADKVKDTIEKFQQSWQEEYRFKCADGNYKHIRDKGFIVYENGLPVKMIGALHDVSYMKDLENRLADEKVKQQKEMSETVIRVQEKERTQIGYELHDNVNQLLSATKLFVDVLVPHGKEQQMIKRKSIEYLQMAIDEIRKLSKELVAPQVKEKGLTESIRDMADDIELTGVMQIRFVHDLEINLLSQAKKITLFRIVQEQLKNILKHSKASNTSIFLQNRHGKIQLMIQDNGEGFDPRQTRRGIGLSNIQERARFYNGTVDIKAAPGKGCTLMVTIPAED
jgi:PAS domain S-box-containing protein